MNPWAFVSIGVGIILIIIGVKGSQHNIAAAIVNRGNKPASSSTVPATVPNTGPVVGP